MNKTEERLPFTDLTFYWEKIDNKQIKHRVCKMVIRAVREMEK